MKEGSVSAVYASMDRAIASGLERMLLEEGLQPFCRIGCCHCCSFPILINIAESRALAQFVKRSFSPEQIRRLRAKTEQWHEWDDASRRRRAFPRAGTQSSLPSSNPGCPLLEEGACSAYDLRPTVCRVHFVSSHPLYCCAANNPHFPKPPPSVMISIVTATTDFSAAIRTLVEEAGFDYSRTMSLLPHGLAMEMGWDFAIE